MSEKVESRIRLLKGRLDSIDMMLGGDVSPGQTRELVADWHATYRSISRLQGGEEEFTPPDKP